MRLGQRLAALRGPQWNIGRGHVWWSGLEINLRWEISCADLFPIHIRDIFHSAWIVVIYGPARPGRLHSETLLLGIFKVTCVLYSVNASPLRLIFLFIGSLFLLCGIIIFIRICTKAFFCSTSFLWHSIFITFLCLVRWVKSPWETWGRLYKQKIKRSLKTAQSKVLICNNWAFKEIQIFIVLLVFFKQ